MKRWKRILFSVISLIWGYVSLDYLYYAYRMLAAVERKTGAYPSGMDILMQVIGAGMFLLWFVILAVYGWAIRRSSFQIDVIEQDERSGEPRIHRKWFDLLLQGGMILTGVILRWCYLFYVLFPGR